MWQSFWRDLNSAIKFQSFYNTVPPTVNRLNKIQPGEHHVTLDFQIYLFHIFYSYELFMLPISYTPENASEWFDSVPLDYKYVNSPELSQAANLYF